MNPSPRRRTPIWVRDPNLFQLFGRMLLKRRPKTAQFDICFLNDYYLGHVSYLEIFEKYGLREGSSKPCENSRCRRTGNCCCGLEAKILKSKYDPRLHGTRRLQERRDYLCELGYRWLRIRKPTQEDWKRMRQLQQKRAERATEIAQFEGGVDPIAFLNGDVTIHEPDCGNVEQKELGKLAMLERQWREQNDPVYRRAKRRAAERAREGMSLDELDADRRLTKAVDLACRGKIERLAKHLGIHIGNDLTAASAKNKGACAAFRGTPNMVDEGNSLPTAA